VEVRIYRHPSGEMVALMNIGLGMVNDKMTLLDTFTREVEVDEAPERDA